MSIKASTIEKTTALSNSEFSYTLTNDFSGIKDLDMDCTGIVMDATILYVTIKNISFLLKTGKRLTARVYKFYYHALMEVCKETGGYLDCYSPDSFLMIYPKEQHDVADVVDIAIKTADLISTGLKDLIEPHGHINFGIGIDKGNILGTKAQDSSGNDRILWYGTSINKAIAISHECNKPYFVGISGTVYQHLDEDHRYVTRRILGIKKRTELWTTVSYQFENVKKHLYQTNFHKTFEED